MRVIVILGGLLAFVQQGTSQTTYNVNALVGGEVILPCDYDQVNDGSIIAVTWTVTVGGGSVNLYIKTTGTTGNQATPPAAYAGRLEMDGDVNLKLTGVTLADDDERQYKCAVVATVNSETSFVNLQVLIQPTAGPNVEVQYDPQPSDISSVPLDTTVTFTCTSTGGRPPANLGWTVTENGTVVPVVPTYTSSNDSQGVGDATSTFNFTTTKYGVTYRVQCTASGPDPIQSRTSALTSITTEKDQSAIPTTPMGQTEGPDVSNAPQTDANSSGPGVVAGAAVGCFIGGLLVGGAAVFLFLRCRTAKNGGKKKDIGAEKQYENVAPSGMSRAVSQRPSSGSDEYEVPMETIQPSSQPPQPSDDYQELRPAIYQSLQKH